LLAVDGKLGDEAFVADRALHGVVAQVLLKSCEYLFFPQKLLTLRARLFYFQEQGVLQHGTQLLGHAGGAPNSLRIKGGLLRGLPALEDLSEIDHTKVLLVNGEGSRRLRLCTVHLRAVLPPEHALLVLRDEAALLLVIKAHVAHPILASVVLRILVDRLVELGLVVLHAMGEVGLALVLVGLLGAASPLALQQGLKVGA
jgi:hypothetical protein